eukprot:gene21142-25399_t
MLKQRPGTAEASFDSTVEPVQQFGRHATRRCRRYLPRAVGDAFARVFGGGVVPQEVEAALQQEARDRVEHLGGGILLAPNNYVITINNSDHEELAADRELTTKAFSRHLQDFIRDQGWQTYGDISVTFEPSPTLHTGQFRTRGTVDPDGDAEQASPPSHVPQPARNGYSHDDGGYATPQGQEAPYQNGYDRGDGYRTGDDQQGYNQQQG